MSEILKALDTGKIEDLHINNEERIMLCEMLACVAAALKSGKLFFNGKGNPINERYAVLAESFARKLANMPVEQQQ